MIKIIHENNILVKVKIIQQTMRDHRNIVLVKTCTPFDIIQSNGSLIYKDI